jgi:hypothetical protein
VHFGPAEAAAPAGDLGLDLGGQRGIGGDHVGKQRVAALGRDDPAVEERAGIGHRLVLAIGMETHPGAPQAERPAVLDGIADDPHLGVHRMVELRRHHDVRLAKPSGEVDMVRRRHAEIAEHQDRVAKPRRFKRVERGVVDAEVWGDADNLGAELALDWPDFEGHRSSSHPFASILAISPPNREFFG